MGNVPFEVDIPAGAEVMSALEDIMRSCGEYWGPLTIYWLDAPEGQLSERTIDLPHHARG